MGRTGRFISAIIVTAFIGTLLEINTLVLLTRMHPYKFLLLQIAIGVSFVIFLVVAYKRGNNPENVIHPKPRRQRRYPWFEPPR
ncbi:MAG: hypothetical protein UY60_C0010G0007 [Parcubacteria group bacterium GW2011_GWB1_50_9]|nr:MAG: hypothetical protein UY60_C0010G0007 [Parcubacteria group bacterium GW2011_GWB1_50_9]